jgi:hypothetical protein
MDPGIQGWAGSGPMMSHGQMGLLAGLCVAAVLTMAVTSLFPWIQESRAGPTVPKVFVTDRWEQSAEPCCCCVDHGFHFSFFPWIRESMKLTSPVTFGSHKECPALGVHIYCVVSPAIRDITACQSSQLWFATWSAQPGMRRVALASTQPKSPHGAAGEKTHHCRSR